MKDRIRAMVLASFVADSFALGAHWIYDRAVIRDNFGRLEDLQAPGLTSFHAGKGRGDFTHYGDQTLVLLRSAVRRKGFDRDGFAEDWRTFFDHYDGYRDHATQETLANFEAGSGPEAAGSRSTDLGGAARIAPLGHVCRNDPEAFVAAARAQTALTHNVPEVVDSAAFFARVTLAVLDGQTPAAAVSSVQAEAFDRAPFDGWVRAGIESAGRKTSEAIAGFGQMCGVQAAFPSVIHLVVRYPQDLRSALVENTMAGGDSAARGMLAGLILGAHLGASAIPAPWVSGMTARAEIEALLSA